MLDPTSEMRALAEKVRQMAQEQGTSVEHVLVVLTTVLLADPLSQPAAASSPVKGAPRDENKEV